jgi:hypothetical protein
LAEQLERSARLHPKLAEVFTVRSGATVAEAYKMVGDIRDGEDGWRFLTAGLLKRHGDHWGRKRARHLGRKFDQPVLPFNASAVTATRRDLYRTQKIVVSGLSRVLKARCDGDGAYAAGVGTFLVVPREAGAIGVRLLRRGTLLLNSAYLSELHRSRYGPMSLSGGNLPLGRRNVEAFPCPACLSRPVPRLSRDAIDGYLRSPRRRLPEEEPVLLGLLDAAFEILSSAHDEAWDLLAQRVILALARCSEDDATAILEAWSQRLVGALP